MSQMPSGSAACITDDITLSILIGDYQFMQPLPSPTPSPSPLSHPGLVHYLRKEKTKSGLEESPVITLTNENFDDIIEASELILVEFYTDM